MKNGGKSSERWKNAVYGLNTATMEMTKAIEQIFPQAPNFAAVQQHAQAKRNIDSPFHACYHINLVCSCGSC
jgi:hypothetical protein